MKRSVAAVALSLLLLGCRAGKTAVVSDIDSVSVTKTEHSERVALSALGGLEADICEVAYYKPDSFGVSRVKSVRKSKVKGVIKEEKESVAISDAHDSVSVSATQKVEGNGCAVKAWIRHLAAFSILLIGLFIGIKFFRK